MAARDQPRSSDSPSATGRDAPDTRDAADAMLVCPNCASRLLERKCKLLCPNPLCGYYLSCSDYY